METFDIKSLGGLKIALDWNLLLLLYCELFVKPSNSGIVGYIEREST